MLSAPTLSSLGAGKHRPKLVPLQPHRPLGMDDVWGPLWCHRALPGARLGLPLQQRGHFVLWSSLTTGRKVGGRTQGTASASGSCPTWGATKPAWAPQCCFGCEVLGDHPHVHPTEPIPVGHTEGHVRFQISWLHTKMLFVASPQPSWSPLQPGCSSNPQTQNCSSTGAHPSARLNAIIGVCVYSILKARMEGSK